MTTKRRRNETPIFVTLPADATGGAPVRIRCRRVDPVAFAMRGLLSPEETVNQWICAAAVSPRIVRTAEEASGNAIFVEELNPDVREAIFVQTNDRVTMQRRIDSLERVLAYWRQQQQH